MTTLKEFLEKEENKNVRSSILDACRSPLVKALMYNDALDKKYVRTTSGIKLITEIISEIRSVWCSTYSTESLKATAYFSLIDSLCDDNNIDAFVGLRTSMNETKINLFENFIDKLIEYRDDLFHTYGANYDKQEKIKELKAKHEYSFLDCMNDDIIDFILTEEIENKGNHGNYVKLVRDLRRFRNNIDVIDFRSYLPSRDRDLLLGDCQLINFCFNKYGIDETIKYMIEQNMECLFYKSEYISSDTMLVSSDVSYLIDRTPIESRKELIDSLITNLGKVMDRKEAVRQLFTDYFKGHIDDETYVDKIAYIIDNYATINGDCLAHLYAAIASRSSTYGLLSKIEGLAYRKNEDGKRVYSEMIQRLIIAIKCCLTKSMSLKDKKTLGEIGTFVEIYHFNYPHIVEATYASEGMNYKY